ncbi:WD repeat-containing protein 60 isoform X3 [Anguilla anguilla]|uniref:WD repeat-containing protein 60 isoform X3 n=1 Tax=Anguilla anguilla TaxID=7936 RepID=UPI0015B366E8|nr:WD repeat-containing protein 60 isoform X3 [Anguilla anguilla]
MHSEKKPTMEDTWKTGDLEKHLKRGVYDEDNMRRKDRRRRDEEGKKGRSGDSERRHRDHEREATRERDRHRERDATGERTKPRDPDKDKDQDRRREGTRDRTAGRDERERERRQERAEEKERVGDNSRARDRGHESRERQHERAEKDSRDGERERRRVERDRERGTERERKREEGRDGDRERDRERTREKERDRDREKDRDREHNYERRKEKDRHRDRERGHSSKHVKEMNDYTEELQEKHYESKRENERRERHGEREHSRRKEDKEYQEQRRKEKEERERRHREREEHPRERRRREDGPKEEERERRRPERQEETRHHLSSDRRSHDQHGKRRPVEEGDGEDGLVQVAPEARLHSGRNRERQEPKETKVEKVEVEIEKVSAEGPGDEDEAEYYEEDFEKMDYEDDFEEIDESDREEGDDGAMSEEGHKEEEELSPQKRREIEEIRRAMNAENERVHSSQQWHAVEESEIAKRNSDVPQRKNTQHGKFIDFVAAKHREVGKKIASKQKKRSAELLRLIDLDFSVTFSLLDLPPVNEYDMYIKSFGTTNTKQAYVQCNEDNTDRDVQTEEIEADDKWTQHPGDSRTVCGGPKLISEASDESMAKMNIDSKRLAEFLLSASQVVAILLEEDRAEMHSWRKQKSQARTLSCSDGCLQLNTKLPFLHGREVSLISFSQVQRQTLLSVHGPATKPSAVRLDSKTILCIWNIWQPSCPQKVLVYESEVLCCCFSPGKATLVFAGTAVGSVVVWDLREHSTLHQTLRIGDNDWTLRYPTFSTDSVLSPVGHFSSVRSVEPVPVAVAEGVRPELSLLPSHQESSGLSFQLASLDESGVMNLWVVVELPKADQAGSQTDLGLKPGGKVKLLHSSTLFTNESRSPQRDAVKTEPLRTLLLKFFPSDSSHFFIGTDMGLVTHGTRHGLKILPKFYRPQEDGLRPVHITTVDVSPFGEPLFLVGCADGSVRMHSVSSEQPVMEWSSSTAGQPVLSVQWALTRPGVFCVLDAASNLHVWDLLEKDYEPVATEELHSDRVTAMAVFGDPAKPNTLSGVSLAKQSGEIEIQYFSKRWAVPAPAEIDTLHNILNKSF